LADREDFSHGLFVLHFMGAVPMAEDEAKTDEQDEQDEQKKQQEPKFKNVVTIEASGPCKKKVCVEVPEEAIKSALDEQYSELRRDAVVPGFRKGRAPLRLLEKRFGKDVGTQVKLKFLSDASEAAIKDNELDALNEPDIDHEKIELPESGPMKFEFEVEVRPEFELPELEGIKIEKPTTKITKKVIDGELEWLCNNAGMWVPKESGVVAAGDQVVVDAVLDVEDEAEDEKHDNIEIFARKNGFVGGVPVENLDEVLAGAQHGDVKKTSIEIAGTFFNERYRGKKIEVEISVKEVKELRPAELNEEFFNRYNVEDEEELREKIQEAMEANAERRCREAMSEQIRKYLLDKTELELPEAVVADQSKHILQRQYSNLLMQGLKAEQIEEQMAALQAGSEEQAKGQMKVFFIMDKVAEKLEVEVSEEEINGHIAQVAMSRGRRPEKMREELNRDGSLAQFIVQIREQKCIEKLLEKAKITEVKTGEAKKTTAKKKTAKKTKKTETKTKKSTRASTTEKRSKKSTSAKKGVKKTDKN